MPDGSGSGRWRPSDARAWNEVRRRNAEWLRPWEATVPPGDTSAPRTFRALVRDLRHQAREHRALPFAVTVDDVFVGQITVTNIVGGSARWAQVGYWIDRRYAGQNVIPTSVALVVDYCLLELGLHRIEVAIRPENTASLRVVEKLGFTEIGYARATCTSTVTGATTGCSRSPPRRSAAACSVASRAATRVLITRTPAERRNARDPGFSHQSHEFACDTPPRLRGRPSVSLLSSVAWTCQESSSWCSPSRGPST